MSARKKRLAGWFGLRWRSSPLGAVAGPNSTQDGTRTDASAGKVL
jgi:hypothetical protein